MPDTIYECPKCGRRWQCSPFRLRYYGAPGQHAPSYPDVALVVADGPICDGRPMPRGEATDD